MSEVAILGPTPHGTTRGGVAVHTERLSHALARAGITAQVYSDSRVWEGSRAQVVGVHGCSGTRRAALIAAHPLAWTHILRRVSADPRVAALGMDPRSAAVRAWLIAEAARHEAPRVVHIQQADFRPLYAQWADLPKRQLITVHGLGALETGEYPALAEIIPENLRRAAAIAVPSQALADEVAALDVPSGRITVIPSGVDHEMFWPRDRAACRRDLGIDPDRPLMVYAGRITEYKGAGDLLAASDLLRDQGLDAMLALVGPLGMPHAPQAHAGLLLPGEVEPDQVALWMGAADIVVVPSHYEGFGLVALEAMACGRPVVATQVGGLAQIVPPEAGAHVAPQDPEALAGALAALLCDGARRARAAAVGIQAASAYTWDRCANAYASLYRSL